MITSIHGLTIFVTIICLQRNIIHSAKTINGKSSNLLHVSGDTLKLTQFLIYVSHNFGFFLYDFFRIVNANLYCFNAGYAIN